MTGPDRPERVLVLYCPDWPDAVGPDGAGLAEPSRGAGPGGGAGLPAGAGTEPSARAFEAVVAVVEEFCPKVEVLRPGACAIGARGPSRYFGGETELARKLTAAVRAAGFPCAAGLADGLFAAELAAAIAIGQADPGASGPGASGPGASGPGASGPAETGWPAAAPVAQAAPVTPAGPADGDSLIVPPGRTPAFLAGQPVSVLGNPDLGSLLPRLGITTLGELAALPAAEAASRLGPPGHLAHRLASGLDPRPLVPRPPAADLSAQREFDPPAAQAEPVIFAAKALAEDLHARLAASGLACIRLQVQVHTADGRQISRLWRHDGLLSGLAVAERVRWQLDGREPGGPPAGGGEHADVSLAGGVTLLRLVPDQLVRATGRQLGLWGDAVVTDRVARAASRVQAMLGHGAVTRPVLAGGRRPADQVLLVPFGDAGTPRRPADRPWPGQIPAPAPAAVYPDPLPARVTDQSGAAVTVTGRAQLSAPPAWLSPAGLSADGRPGADGPALAVTSWAGPWPVTECWWDPARSHRQARFQLVTSDGSAWLAVLEDGRWRIEARYD